MFSLTKLPSGPGGALALAACALLLACAPSARADGPYRLLKEIPVGGDGGWDYLSVDSAGHRLYVAHGNQVVVIDTASDAVVGSIPNTAGVHGVALAPQLNRGFVSDGRANKVTIVDLGTLQPVGEAATGTNPD